MQALTLEQLLPLPQKDLEAFLTSVYKSVGGQTSVAEKLNTLMYFETLCTDGRVSNLVPKNAYPFKFIDPRRGLVPLGIAVAPQGAYTLRDSIVWEG